MSIFEKFKIGLSKSSKGLSSGLNNIIFKKKINKDNLNELEDFLIQSDVGVEVASELKGKFSNFRIKPEDQNKNSVFKIETWFLNCKFIPWINDPENEWKRIFFIFTPLLNLNENKKTKSNERYVQKNVEENI